MQSIFEILRYPEEFTIDEFWTVVAILPDEGKGKERKDNINKYFKKDGTPKAKALSPQSQADYQAIQDTVNFIGTFVLNQIHKNKIRQHIEVHEQHIENLRSKDPEIKAEAKKFKVVRFGKLEKTKKQKRKEENGE